MWGPQHQPIWEGKGQQHVQKWTVSPSAWGRVGLGSLRSQHPAAGASPGKAARSLVGSERKLHWEGSLGMQK